MRATLTAPYRKVTGRDNEKVAYGWGDLDVTFLRDYTIPDNPEGQAAFASKTVPVVSSWTNADSAFKDDIITYTEAYNATQLDGRTQIPLNKLNIFMKAVFPAAEANSFDLSTLTVNNFGGEIGDLLGTEEPNVGNLIETAGLPDCGLDLSTLNNPIVAI